MKSKIKLIKDSKEITTSNWPMRRYVLEMENGDSWSIIKKAPNAFAIGQELDYEIKENKWFTNLVEKRAFTGNPNAGKLQADAIRDHWALLATVQLISNDKVDIADLEKVYDRLRGLIAKG